MTGQYEYRLVEDTYHQSLRYDDSPGSTRDVVSRKTSRIMRTWTNADEEFGGQLLRSGGQVGVYLETDSEDGYVSYSYRLERRLKDGPWSYVGHLYAQSQD